MKDHIKKIALAIVSVCMVFLLIHVEYNRENITEGNNLFFIVENEVIRTWEKEGVQYLFLPSFAKETEIECLLISQNAYQNKVQNSHGIVLDIWQRMGYDKQASENGRIAQRESA